MPRLIHILIWMVVLGIWMSSVVAVLSPEDADHLGFGVVLYRWPRIAVNWSILAWALVVSLAIARKDSPGRRFTLGLILIASLSQAGYAPAWTISAPWWIGEAAAAQQLVLLLFVSVAGIQWRWWLRSGQ